MADKSPKGVIAVFTDERGNVIASQADFAPDRPGGFTMIEAQRRRAEDLLASKVVYAYASPALGRAIDPYTAQQIVRKLTSNHGCKMKTIPIGYSDEEAANL